MLRALGGRLLPSFVLAAFGLLVLAPTLGAQFVLVDDHEILRFSLPEAGHPLSHLVPLVSASDPAAGRLRPVYWLVRLGQVALFGDNPLAWHASVLAIAVACASLLYATARGLGLSQPLALLLGAWLLVAPGVSSNWVRLGTNETIAMPFFLLAAFAATRPSRAADVVFVLASLVAMLAKESFALAGPALAGIRVAAIGSRGKTSAVVVLVMAVAVCIGDFLVARNAGVESYGGAFLSAPGLSAYALNAAHNFAILVFATSCWLALLVVGRNRTRRLLLATVLMLVLVVPQVLLYSRSGILEGKYQLPAAVGLAVWLAFALALESRKRIRRLGMASLAVVVLLQAGSTWSYANYFSQDSRQLFNLVQQVAATAPPSAIVAIAGDPAADFEPMLSLVHHFAHAGRPDLQLKALPIDPEMPYSPRLANLAEQLLATPLGNPQLTADQCDRLGAVIVLRDEPSIQRSLPCTSGMARLDFTQSVPLWGGDQVSMRPRLPGAARAGYVVLVPRSA